MNNLRFFFFLSLFVLAQPLSGQTFRSVNNPPSNAWNDPLTWDLGSVPGTGDTVLIRNNDTVNVTTNTSIDKITLRGNGELNVNTGVLLSILQNLAIQAQNDNGNFTSVIVDGTVSVGNNLSITSRKKINYTADISGTGNISASNNFTITGDTSGTTATLSTPISVGNNFTVTAKNPTGSINTLVNTSISIVKNLTLRSQNGADSTDNLFDMRFSGSSLDIGNNLNLTTGGGFLLNSSAITSDISFTTFAKIKISDQLNYHNVHVKTSSNVNADKDFNTIFGGLFIDNGCIINTNRRTWKMSSGNLVVNGSIESFGGDDSLIFNGSAAQTITGSGSAVIECLVIENILGVTNSITLDIIKTLNIESGNFATGDKVTLKSTSARTAYIPEIGTNGVGASISGEVICERNITGAASIGYRHLSSPVQGSTIADIQDGVSSQGIYTYGYTGSNSPGTTGYNSSYQYDPALANGSGVLDDGWVAATNSTNALTPNQAWSFYIGGTSGSGAKTNYDLSVSGEIYSGNVVLNSINSNIAANSGGVQEWGFIGNPYPSAIQWDNVTKSNISGVAQIYGEDDYNGYRATNFNAATNRIPPFQAFWVQTTGVSPFLIFEENDKITNNIGFRKSAQIQNRLYLEMVDSSNNFNVKACLEFNDQASPKFDLSLDGLVFKNPWPYPNIYFPIQDSLNGQVYSTNKDDSQIIPLKMYASKGKKSWVSLRFNQLPELKVCLKLEDRILGKIIPIDTNTVYKFQLNEDELENRFYIHYLPGASEIISSHLECYQSADGEISFTSPTPSFNPILLNSFGQTIPLLQKKNRWVSKNLEAGKYRITLDGDSMCNTLTFPVDILEPAVVKSSFSISKDSFNINEAVHFSNQSSGANSFEWQFSNGSKNNDFEPIITFQNSGIYVVDLIASNGNESCNDTSFSSLSIIPGPSVGFISNHKNSPLKIAQVEDEYFLLTNFDAHINMDFTLSDMQGKIWRSESFSIRKTRLLIHLPEDHGMYILHISTNKGEQYFKLIKK